MTKVRLSSSCVLGLLLMLVLGGRAAGAQEKVTLNGRVVDTTGTPLGYASLSAERRGRWTADEGGRFVIEGVPGEYRVDVRRIGYMPARVVLQVRQDTTIEIAMIPAAVRLDEQRVIAARTDALARNGFYDRMRDGRLGLNNGHFITPEDIEERRASRTTQYIERIPGIRMMNTTGGAIPATSSNCVLTIYLDGMRLNTADAGQSPQLSGLLRGGSGPRRDPPRDQLVDHIVSPTSVAAIEVYPRAVGAPAQYQMLNGTCGIMAIWTKS